jgi:hypothetical protein
MILVKYLKAHLIFMQIVGNLGQTVNFQVHCVALVRENIQINKRKIIWKRAKVAF